MGIDGKSPVNIYGIISAGSIAVSCVFWFASIASNNSAVASRVDKIELKQKSFEEIMGEDHDRVIRIEEKVTNIQESIKQLKRRN